MDRLKMVGVIALTALITAVLTSTFWFVAFNRGAVAAGTPDVVLAPTGGPSSRVPRGELKIGPTGLAIPVVGVKPGALQDTFTQARAGGARVHDAIDIMAPHGTPVVAAAPGRVEKLYFSQGGGGISAYIRSPDGQWTYYYAHLQAYAPGLQEGQVLRQGDPIGTVGSTGNANPAGPHLHFAIHHMAAGEKWHQGTAINPYPLLAGR